MSEKFRLDRKIAFRNTFYPKCINVIIDCIGPSIILRSILRLYRGPRLNTGTTRFNTERHVLWRVHYG